MISLEKLPSMIDIAVLNPADTGNNTAQACAIARAYGCASVLSLPFYLPLVCECLNHSEEITAGSVTGFPTGGDLTSAKAYQAGQLVMLGAQEIDMVMNVGAFLSGKIDTVTADINAVCKGAGVPIKVIIETAFLNDEQIAEAAALVADSPAPWVKNSTGMYGAVADVRTIRLIKDAVGDKVKIKAAGGIRDLDTMLALADAGAERFGIGAKSVLPILHEIDRRLSRDRAWEEE